MHFGIIVTLNLAIGQQTPPVASVLVTACSVAKADIWDVTSSNISFICVLLVLFVVCEGWALKAQVAFPLLNPFSPPHQRSARKH